MFKKQINIIDISIFLTIASTTLYLVFRNLGREIGSFAYLWAPISLLLILLSCPYTYLKRPMKLLLFYGLIMVGILQYFLWQHMNEWNRIQIRFEFYYLVIMVIILLYYRQKDEFRQLAFIGKWGFIFILITLISTNIALFIDPYVVRQSAASAGFTEIQRKIFIRYGTLNYSYAQSLVCLIPILVYFIKNKKRTVFSTRVLTIIILLIFITEIRIQVFANLLVSFFILVLSLLASSKKHKFFISIVLFGILLMITPVSSYSKLFYSLGSHFDQDSLMKEKLNDFAFFLIKQEFDNSSEAGGRAERYPMLYKAFISKPFLGDASYNSQYKIDPGGHVFWMNRLTLWGILGFFLYVFILYKIFYSITSLFDPSFKLYYQISLIAYVSLGLIKVIGGREPLAVLIVIIPGLYYYSKLLETNPDIIQQLKHGLQCNI